MKAPQGPITAPLAQIGAMKVHAVTAWLHTNATNLTWWAFDDNRRRGATREVMCVACGCGYVSRPGHREHNCGAY